LKISGVDKSLCIVIIEIEIDKIRKVSLSE